MDTLTPEQTQLLTKMLVSHAYREKLAAARFTDALALAPSRKEAKYVQHVVDEERDHYERCVRVARELSLDIEPLVEARMQQGPHGIPPFDTWLDVLMAHAFNDQAGYHVMRGIVGSKVTAYAKMCEIILQEEEGHGATGARWLVTYYRNPALSEEFKREKLELHLDAALRCLGRPNSRFDRVAVAAGLKGRPAEETISEFCEYTDKVLVDMGCAAWTPIQDRADRYAASKSAAANL